MEVIEVAIESNMAMVLPQSNYQWAL
jgi:hypothetical protein